MPPYTLSLGLNTFLLMSDYLYSIIEELDKQERSYITNTLKVKKSDNLLLTFFNYLCEHKKLEEQAIKAHINNDTFIKYYPQYKRKLFKAILKIMRQYNRNDSFEKDMYDQLKDIVFLVEKGRRQEAFKIADKCQKLSCKNELFDIEQIFIKWKLMLASSNPDMTNKTAIYESNLKTAEDNLAKNAEMFGFRVKHYKYLFQKVHTIKKLPPNQRSIKARALMKELDLHVNNTGSKEIEYGNHLLHYQLYLLDNEFEHAQMHLEKGIGIIRSKSRLEDRDHHNYVIGVVNLIEIALVNRRANEMKIHLDDLLKVKAKYGERSLVKPLLKIYLPLFQLQFAILTGDFEGNIPIKEIVTAINDERTGKANKSFLCLTCATYYWIIGKYNKALDFILQFKDFQLPFERTETTVPYRIQNSESRQQTKLLCLGYT